MRPKHTVIITISLEMIMLDIFGFYHFIAVNHLCHYSTVASLIFTGDWIFLIFCASPICKAVGVSIVRLTKFVAIQQKSSIFAFNYNLSECWIFYWNDNEEWITIKRSQCKKLMVFSKIIAAINCFGRLNFCS